MSLKGFDFKRIVLCVLLIPSCAVAKDFGMTPFCRLILIEATKAHSQIHRFASNPRLHERALQQQDFRNIEARVVAANGTYSRMNLGNLQVEFEVTSNTNTMTINIVSIQLTGQRFKTKPTHIAPQFAYFSLALLRGFAAWASIHHPHKEARLVIEGETLVSNSLAATLQESGFTITRTPMKVRANQVWKIIRTSEFWRSPAENIFISTMLMGANIQSFHLELRVPAGIEAPVVRVMRPREPAYTPRDLSPD